MEDNDYRITVGGRTVVGIGTWSISTVDQADRIDLGDKVNMGKSQVAELVLDARSLWQMYYVEGIVAFFHLCKDFWEMKAEMAELAGLDLDLKYGCPLCEYFYKDNNYCVDCPIAWHVGILKHVPCELKGSPYLQWKNSKTVEESRAACEGMISLCEKWLDENHFSYEK
jgi:hypothetical protein